MKKKDYKIRVFLVFILFLVLYAIILVRLFLIQIYQKDFFKVLAQQQYHVDMILDPGRALIIDRTQTLLAFNRDVPSAFVLPHQLSNASKTMAFLEKHFHEVYEKIRQYPERHFLWLERKLTSERFKQFQQWGIDDIQFIQEPQRFYPYKELAHLIGFTDIDNQGIAGIELAYSKRLRGTPTQVVLEKDARSKHLYFEKKIKQQGVKGLSVELTIDRMVQFLAYEQLKETVDQYGALLGSVLVINPDNGEILAMVNYPTFDPNHKVSSLEITKNTIVTECYEMGSVMKMFAALAALEEGVVKYDELIDCEGKVTYLERFRVENWKSVDIIPFCDVLKFSSNVGIAKVALRLGPKLHDHLKGLGFGKKTGIVFPGERDGFVNPPSHWSRSSVIVMSFGYEIMASLLQLGIAVSVIANGGYTIQPQLFKEPRFAKPFERRKLYKDQTIYQVKNILEVIGQRYGVTGYRVMGKTGTARMIVDGHYSNKKHVYTFAGIIEKGDYRRVIVTFVKEPVKSNLWAADVAAPLFQKIAEKIVIHEMNNRSHSPGKALGI